MPIERESAYILILLCLPLQFNLFTDSWQLIAVEIVKDWKDKKEFTYYENYFGKKATMYVATVFSIIFIFIFYKLQKMKLILSVTFALSAITWLIYFGVNENNMYLVYTIRSIQGVYMACFHVACLPYMMNFVKNSSKCFCGCLVQFSMFLGLFTMNLLFVYLTWSVIVVIMCVLSLAFSALIWLVPEYHVNPKSMTNEYIHKKENFKLLVIMLLAMFLQHISGIGILLGQLSKVLAELGLDIDMYLQTCLFDFVGTIAVINSAFMTDIITTRNMWTFSAFGLCVGLIIYGITLKIKMDNWISSVGVFIYFLFYGLGVGPIPWYLNGTFFSEDVRIESSGINLFWNLFLSPIMDFIWDKLRETFGQFGSVVFALISCFISMFYGLFVIPNDNNDDDDNINIL